MTFCTANEAAQASGCAYLAYEVRVRLAETLMNLPGRYGHASTDLSYHVCHRRSSATSRWHQSMRIYTILVIARMIYWANLRTLPLTLLQQLEYQARSSLKFDRYRRIISSHTATLSPKDSQACRVPIPA